MSHCLNPRKQSALLAAFMAGATVRQVMREHRVAKHTAWKYLRLAKGQSAPVMPQMKPASKKKLDICRNMRQAERVKIWESVNPPAPEGKRVGWTCAVPYCGFLEHMAIADDLTYGQNHIAPYKNKLESLEIGEFFEAPREIRNSLASYLFGSMAKFIIRMQPDRKTLRIIRTGSWIDRQAAYKVAAQFPVLVYREAKPFHGLRWWFPLTDAESLHRNEVPKRRHCTVKACAFPATGNEQGLCQYHFGKAQYLYSIMDGAVWWGDYAATDDNPTPIFTAIPQWQEPTEYLHCKFEHNGARNRGEKISDEYWQKLVLNVLKPDLKPGENIQHTGAFVLWKGFGRRKIRKTQRNRPTGWHGNHPEQKPVKVERTSITDIPIWTPAKRTPLRPPLTRKPLPVDDDNERQELIETINTQEFAEAFA